VNPTERAALLQGMALHDEMTAALNDRTLEILHRRRSTATIRRRGWLVRRMLLLADVLGISAAFLLTELVFGGHGGRVGAMSEPVLFVLTLPAWIVVARLYSLYDHDEERTDHSTGDDLSGVFHLATIGVWLVFAGAWATQLAHPDFPKLVLFWALTIALVTGLRATARSYCRGRMTYLQNTVIVGCGDVGQLVARKLTNHPEYGINLVGFVDADPKEQRDDLAHIPVLGSPERLPALVRLFDVERIVFAFSNGSHEETLELIRSLRDLDVQIDIVPRLFEMVGPRIGIHSVEGLPLVSLPPMRLARSAKLAKRSMDLVLSVAGLIVLAPVLAVLALLIKRDSPGPVFFRQVRMGAGERTFRIFKLRTMAVDADARKAEVMHLNKHGEAGGDPRMFKISDDPRVTRIGKFLRSHSLDELPQLINVVKGEMSLVGPRPLILEEDRFVATWARRRLNLKPGITGPWQVLGRSDIPFEEMIKFDYLYVTGWSPLHDLKLILRTLPLIVRHRGAY
jgi:exopolysaccharide biosynthesis polyprenyl glycosylphosphotransferase